MNNSVAMSLAPPPSPTSKLPPTAGALGGERHLFRYGLRQFLGFVSGLALLLGTMAYIRSGWSVGLAFLAALVAAHVLATSVGTRLRDSSVQAAWWSGRGAGGGGPPMPRPRLTPAELAAFATPPLAEHERAPLRTLLAAVGGLLTGGFLGAAGVPVIAGPEATAAGIALGAASCAVMGAWLALLVAHFYSVSRRAWRDANRAGQGAKRVGVDGEPDREGTR